MSCNPTSKFQANKKVNEQNPTQVQENLNEETLRL